MKTIEINKEKRLSKKELADLLNIDKNNCTRRELLNKAIKKGLIPSIKLSESMDKGELADYLGVDKNTLTEYNRLARTHIISYKECCYDHKGRLSDNVRLNFYQINVILWIRDIAVRFKNDRTLMTREIKQNVELLNEYQFRHKKSRIQETRSNPIA